MALDRGLVQNISLRTDGEQLLKPIDAFSRAIVEAINKLTQMNGEIQQGSNKNANAMRAQVQYLQRLVGEASTLQNILNGTQSRRRDNLLSPLDANAMGARARSASQLTRDLKTTDKAADALGVRMAQLNKRFDQLALAGRNVTKTDLGKAFHTEEAVRSVRQLEREIAKLDRQTKSLGGGTSDTRNVRAQLQTAQDRLLTQTQNPRRVNWSTEIGQVETLAARYRSLAMAELEAAKAADRTATATRRSLLQNINQTEEMLRSSLTRGASKYQFTPDQARNTDMKALGQSIDQNMLRLSKLQTLMSRALNPENPRAIEVLNRLQGAWERISGKTSEAIALQKAYSSLPEQRGKAVTQALFGDGGVAFGGRVAGAMAIASLAGSVIGGIQNAVSDVVKFEDELAKLQAISGATDQQMVRLSASILDVASSSRYSTVEIAQAATIIAQAGFSAAETGTLLKDSLNLAAASGSSPTEAVDTLTSALGAFQLQASESTRVVDTLVQGLNRSKLSITQMQAAIQYAGATAQENGVRLEELTAIAASLANAGIRSGSTIGTGLRQMLVDLKTPTKDFQAELQSLGLTLADVDVKTLGLAEVVRRLTDAGFSAEAAYSSFEVRAAASFLAFRNQIHVYDEMALALAEQGAAAKASDNAMESMTAKGTKLRNILVETAGAMSGPFRVALEVIFDTLSGVFSIVNDVNSALGGIPIVLAVIAAAAAANPVLGIITGMFSLVAIVKSATNSLENLHTATSDAEAQFQSSQTTIDTVDDSIENLINRSETLQGNQVALQAETLTLTGRFEGLANQLKGTATDYDELLAAMLRYRGEALRQAAVDAEAVRIAAKDEKAGLLTQVSGLQQGMVPNNLRNKNFSSWIPKSLGGAYNTALKGLNDDPTKWDYNKLFSMGIDIQAGLNDVNKSKDNGPYTQQLKQYLEKLLDLVQQLRSTQLKIDNSDRQIGVYNERVSPAGQARDQAVLDAQKGINSGLSRNKATPGSGQSIIDSTMATAQRRIDALRAQLEGVDPKSAKGMALNTSISELGAQMARVKRDQDAADRDAEKSNITDKPGARLSMSQISAELQRQIPNARITDTTRSVGRQAGYDKAAGIKRDPSQAPHVTGNALDMAPIAGMDPMEVVAMLEEMGLTVTGAPVHRAGTRYITPNHGTGKHWHFQWSPKKTAFEKSGDQAATKAAQELKQLVEAQAGAETATASAKVSTVLNQAKGGSISVSTLNSTFESALTELRTAKLSEFDVKNPTEGLSETLLKQRALARAALEAQISQEAADEHAKLWRAISDFAGKELSAAMSAAKDAFENAKFAANDNYEQVASKGRTLGNNVNKTKYGAGVQYAQQRDEFSTRLQSDKDIVQALGGEELNMTSAIDKYREQLKTAAPDSENYLEIVEKLRGAEKDLLDVQRERAEVQRTINERTQDYTAIPLGQRLRESVAAWADNSGAMDTWGKTLENNIGPALDEFSSQLGTMFSQILSGTATVQDALAGFIKAFAQFVLQIIAKALALMAVKAILSAFGLQLDSGAGGVTIGAKGSFEGGPVVANDNQVEGRYGGGPITRGMPTHDSALYNLAQGEYVIRNKSVRDLGLPFLDAVNKDGRAGLDKMAGAGSIQQNIQAPRQETNVWIVKEKESAPMGPSDVLVVIHKDILQNGPTKKLIRSVAQGG